MQRWFSFEEEIRLLTGVFGYSSECTPASGDHGVDIIAEKNGRRVAVQVKLYGNTKVGNQTVLTLLGGMHVYHATEALLITTGKLTKQAIVACQKAGVVYYDRESLFELCTRKKITLPSWCVLQNIESQEQVDLDSDKIIGRSDACEIYPRRSHNFEDTL